MFGHRYGLTALVTFLVASPSPAAVITHEQADEVATAQLPVPRLKVFGRPRTELGQRATLRKLDGVLAEISEHYVHVPADRSLANLHAINPAARLRMAVPFATPEVLIDAVTTGDPQSLKRSLEQIGMRDASVFSNDVGGWLPVEQLPAAAALAGLKFARASMPRTRAASLVATQGDFAQRSAAVRATYPNLTGAGLTVGVLSDSFNCYQSYADAHLPYLGLTGYAQNGLTATYADDQKSGALPAGVNVLKDASCPEYGAPDLLPFTDEGRAILQIVHAVAPEAKLAYHTAVESEADFANGILALAQAGAKIIDDDVGYANEPFFQDGLIAQAIDQVAAQGVAYFTAAGNNGDQSSYENDSPDFSVTSNSAPNPGEHLLNFDTTGTTSTTSLQLSIPPLVPGEFIPLVIEWDQPYVTGAPHSGGATSSLDLCVTSASGSDPISDPASFPNTVSCTGPNELGTDPVQVLYIGNPASTHRISNDETITISIGLVAGAPPGKIKFLADANGALVFSAAFTLGIPTIQGHAGAAGAATVGAVSYVSTPACLPDVVSRPVGESFSSMGGGSILFSADGTRLASPLRRQKPDFMAPDQIKTTFLGITAAQTGFPATDGRMSVPQCSFDPLLPSFLGTSAAAPHAAAAAALLWQAIPALTPTQIITALQQSALRMFGGVVNDRDGYGFIQVDAALAQLPSGQLFISVSPTSITAGDSATLTWSAINMTGCTASGSWAGNLTAGGTQVVSSNNAGSETYTLTCTSADRGSVTGSAKLTVNAKSVAGGGESGGGGGGGGSLDGLSLLLLCSYLLVRRFATAAARGSSSRRTRRHAPSS